MDLTKNVYEYCSHTLYLELLLPHFLYHNSRGHSVQAITAKLIG